MLNPPRAECRRMSDCRMRVWCPGKVLCREMAWRRVRVCYLHYSLVSKSFFFASLPWSSRTWLREREELHSRKVRKVTAVWISTCHCCRRTVGKPRVLIHPRPRYLVGLNERFGYFVGIWGRRVIGVARGSVASGWNHPSECEEGQDVWVVAVLTEPSPRCLSSWAWAEEMLLGH